LPTSDAIVTIHTHTSLQDVFQSSRRQQTETKEDLPPEALVLSRNWAKNFLNNRLENLSTTSLIQLCELLGLPHTVRATKTQLLEQIDLLVRNKHKQDSTDEHAKDHQTIIPDSTVLQGMDCSDLVVFALQLGLPTRVTAPDDILRDRIKIVRNYLLRQVAADPYVDRFVEPQDRRLYEQGEAFLKQVARALGVQLDGTAYHLTKRLRGSLAVLTEPEKMLLNYYYHDDDFRELKRLCRGMGIEVDKAKITLIRRLDSMRLAQLLIQQRLQTEATAATVNDNTIPSPDLLSWNDDPQLWERQCTDTLSLEQLHALCRDWSLHYNPRKTYSKAELVKLLCKALHIRMPDNPIKVRRKWLDKEIAELKRRLGDAYVKPAPYSGADPLGTIQYGHLRKSRSATVPDSSSDDDSGDSSASSEDDDDDDSESDLDDFGDSDSAENDESDYASSDDDDDADDENDASGDESISKPKTKTRWNGEKT